MEKLLFLQNELKCSKNQVNEFGHFNYRNVENMLTEIKTVLAKNNAILKMDNELVLSGDKHFMKTTATFVDLGNNYSQSATSFAAIDFDKKGMDASQACGSAQTYAEKYALNALFLIDDGKLDPDADEPKEVAQPEKLTIVQPVQNAKSPKKDKSYYLHKDVLAEYYKDKPELVETRIRKVYKKSGVQYLNPREFEEEYRKLVELGEITALEKAAA